MEPKSRYVVSVKSTREMAYKTLRQEIISMELKPGTAISTQDTALRLKVSRTPVREAFIKLHEERLLEVSPQKATVVSRIDRDRVRQECFIREALEVANMRQFAAIASEGTLAEMRRILADQYVALQGADYDKYLELDNLFHSKEFTDTNAELARTLIQQMNGHYDRVRLIDMRRATTAGRVLKEHEQLVDHIARREIEDAVTLLQKHIQELQVLLGPLAEKWPEYFE